MNEVLIGLISALIGFSLGHIYHEYDKKRYKHEKAVEIAREFEVILSSSDFTIPSILNHIYEELEIDAAVSFLNDKDKINELEFDRKEQFNLIGEKKITDYNNFQDHENTRFIKVLTRYNITKDNERFFNKVIQGFDNSLTISDNLKRFVEDIQSNEVEEDSDEFDKKKFTKYRLTEELSSYIENLVIDYEDQKLSILNKLEWISMSFVTGLADSDFVYQSLHQTYFAIITLYYMEIAASNNREAYDKYFTNIIALYKDWKTKYFKRKIKHDKKMKRINQFNKGKV